MRPLATILPALLGVLLLAAAGTEPAATSPQPQTLDPRFAVVAPALAADSAPGTLAQPTPTPTPGPARCGYRSAVRTLADPDAATIDRAAAPGSIAQLLALDRPAGLGPASPRQSPLEAGAIALEVWLRGAIRTADAGIDLLLSTSPDGPLLRASFPGLECQQGASDADRAAMERARAAFVAACGVPSATQWRSLGGRATLVGIPMWGEPRPNATDGAPSGIELAPVLAFELPAGGSCDPGQPFGPTPTPAPGAPLEVRIHLDPYKSVARGTTITVTVIVQTIPGLGGTPTPGPAGIACSYQAFDRLGTLIAQGGPAPTGADGTAQFTFTIPATAATGTPSQPGSVTASCTDSRTQPPTVLRTPGGARLEIVE